LASIKKKKGVEEKRKVKEEMELGFELRAYTLIQSTSQFL
jgi:hypothetical protein